MGTAFLILGVVLGVAGFVALFTGAWLAALGLFAYGSLAVAAECVE